MGPKFEFRSLILATSALCALAVAPAHADSVRGKKTPMKKTPIKHLIIVIRENHTFDNLFGTYKPEHGRTISSLLSKGIVNADGSPGSNFDLAEQHIGRDENVYNAVTASSGAHTTLRQPYTTWADPSTTGLPSGALDTRFPADLPNGPFRIRKYVSYAA